LNKENCCKGQVLTIQNAQTKDNTENIDIGITDIKEKMDISNFIGKFIDNLEKISLLDSFWRPTPNFHFPPDKINRKFNYSWFNEYPWLAYSKSEDGVYCKFCVLFANKNVGSNNSFLLDNW